MGGERNAYGMGGSCTCGAMSDHVGMTRVVHWHGQYKGEGHYQTNLVGPVESTIEDF